MTLSPRQRMQVIDDISAAMSELSVTSKPRQKMQIIEDIGLLMAKLGGSVTEVVKTLFQQITNKAFDSLGAVEVFSKIKSEVDRITREIIGGDSAIDKQLLDACIHCADLAEQAGIA